MLQKMLKLDAKYLFAVTHYDDDADMAATPLALANKALAAGGDVLLWLSVDGTELARNFSAAMFAAAQERLTFSFRIVRPGGSQQ